MKKSKKNPDGVIVLTSSTKEKLTDILNIVNKHLDRVNKDSAGQILYNYLESTGFLTKLLNPDTIESEKRAKNISKFFDKLKTYEVEHEDSGVYAVVDWIELSQELGESPLASDVDWNEVNAVNILTVHSSKGLEFPVVFLVNLVSQRFPSAERREQIPIPLELIKEILPKGDYHLQEERRLFYVGMTRAKERLMFTASDFYGEGKREKKLSPFIFEALGDRALSSEVYASSEQLKLIDYSPLKIDSHLEKEEIHLDYLSVSQIETFEACPMHYKLKYILKIPTPPTAALSFGISIHETLKDFFLELKNGDVGKKKSF